MCVQFIYVSIIYRMLDADKSHLDVTLVSQSLYSGPLSNPDFFLSLIAGRIRQVVLYYDRSFRAHRQSQALPLGQMQTEIWNKAILLSLTNHPTQAASRSSVVSSFKFGNQKFCFAYNITQGFTRRLYRFNH